MQTPPDRPSGRAPDAMRSIGFERGYTCHAEGSVLVSFGRTKVICTASVNAGVPGFLRGKGEGWLTAEYGMLPRSTGTRMDREAARGKQGGRTVEIQRLIGRSLRAVFDLKKLTGKTLWIDCDVLQADGGTRTAAITGSYVALADALTWARGEGHLASDPLIDSVAAVSVGIIDGEPRLDLHYDDDVRAETDMNVVMTGAGTFVEVQGTAEGDPFDRALLDRLLDLASAGIADLTAMQKAALDS